MLGLYLAEHLYDKIYDSKPSLADIAEIQPEYVATCFADGLKRGRAVQLIEALVPEGGMLYDLCNAAMI